jgi:hypothetical protein
VVRKEWIAVMPTPREYRQRAEECLKLASEAKEIYARMEPVYLPHGSGWRPIPATALSDIVKLCTMPKEQ